jgi:hypothetical protein
MLQERTTASIKCPNGHDNDPGIDSCLRCGAPLQVEASPAADDRWHRILRSPLTWLVIALTILVAGVGVWAMTRPSGGTAAPADRSNVAPPSPVIAKQGQRMPATIKLSWTLPDTPTVGTVTGFQILAKDGMTVIGTAGPDQLKFSVSKVPGSRVLIPGNRYCFQIVTRRARELPRRARFAPAPHQSHSFDRSRHR